MSPRSKSPSPKTNNPIPPEIEPEVQELTETVRDFAKVFLEGGIQVGVLIRRLRDAAFEEVRAHEEAVADKAEEKTPRPEKKTLLPGLKKISAPRESSVALNGSHRKRGTPTKRMKDVGLRKSA